MKNINIYSFLFLFFIYNISLLYYCQNCNMEGFFTCDLPNSIKKYQINKNNTIKSLKNQSKPIFEPNSMEDKVYYYLSMLTEELKKNNITFWAEFGTLLGAVREKDIIKGDYDFDIGAFYEDKDKLLNLKFKEIGAMVEEPKVSMYTRKSKFKYKEKKKKSIAYLGFIGKNGYHSCINLYSKFKDGYIRIYDPISKSMWCTIYIIPKIIIDNPQYLKIRNLTIPTPRFSEKCFLEYIYAKEWKIPISKNTEKCKNIYDIQGNNKYPDLQKLNKCIIEEYRKEGKEIKINKPYSLKSSDIKLLFYKYVQDSLMRLENITLIEKINKKRNKNIQNKVNHQKRKIRNKIKKSN